MAGPDYQQRRLLEQLDANALAQHQLSRLNGLLARILPQNPFYREKLAGLVLPLESLEALAGLPFTVKDELDPTGEPSAVAANLTYPVQQYVRFHRTSGTRGRPLVVLDTAEDWQWWIDSWQYVLDAGEIGPDDRALMAFSFGPFIGFWSAYDALVARGVLVIPGGGMSTLARLDLVSASRATALFCTPSYALHLAEIARENQKDLHACDVRRIVVAGEPGGSVPAIRERIESAFGAQVVDHSGSTEVGPWGYADSTRQGLHVNEAEFIAEFISPETDHRAQEGELSELVLTTLGRAGCPVIRYRTGDMVRPRWGSAKNCRFVVLEGGVLGRVDDMMIIRGVNVFPSSMEQILRGFSEISEYRLTATRVGELDNLVVEIEDPLNQPDRVAQEFQLRLGLRLQVRCVPAGSLPRFEGKGRRFVDQRE